MTFDTVSDQPLACANVAGSLAFRTNRDTRLTVGTIMVLPEGSLTVGSEATPVEADAKAEIVIADQTLDTGADPEQFGTGLIGFGKVTIHGSVKTPTFVRLSNEPLAGQDSLSLSEPPRGWRQGDQLVVPDTRQLRWTEVYGNYRPQYEELTAGAVEGTRVTFTPHLRFDHRGARNPDGKLEFLPHVANLTRNVVIRSANPSGTRGHAIFMARAVVDIRYAQFSHLGRTTIAPLDSTTFDQSGKVSNLGKNQIGRYSLHMHHLMGPPKGSGTAYQFTLIGNVVDEGPKWGITVHNSHYGLIRDNVVYDVKGASYMAEDGNESFNVFDHNFAMRGRGTGGREGGGREGTGFYFKGPNNIVRNNVATNMLSDEPDAAYGFKFFFVYLGDIKVPKYPGADTTQEGQYVLEQGNTIGLRAFENNETYGASESGLTYWWVGANVRMIPGARETTIKNMRVWHVYNKGVFHYPAARLTIDGLVVRGDVNGDGMCGFEGSDYVARDITIRNADIQGMGTGISFSTDGDEGWQLLDNSKLRNRVNVQIGTMFTSAPFANELRSRRIIVNNTHFLSLPGPTKTVDIQIGFAATPIRNLIARDEVFIYGLNGVKGDDFEVFYREQAPDFIIPVTIPVAPGSSSAQVLGAPEAGLSNARAWQRHKIAVGGQIARCASTRPEVQGGFVCPVQTPYVPPVSVRLPNEKN